MNKQAKARHEAHRKMVEDARQFYVNMGCSVIDRAMKQIKIRTSQGICTKKF